MKPWKPSNSLWNRSKNFLQIFLKILALIPTHTLCTFSVILYTTKCVYVMMTCLLDPTNFPIKCLKINFLKLCFTVAKVSCELYFRPNIHTNWVKKEGKNWDERISTSIFCFLICHTNYGNRYPSYLEINFSLFLHQNNLNWG